MYGKVFESMYDGTLYGQWEAIITFQQLIVLADKFGIVDMTQPAVSARTSIPLNIIENGIGVLLKEDKYSRSSKLNGKRLVLIDEERPWGWEIVNYEYYRTLASKEDKREKDRIRIKEKRKKNKESEDSRDESQDVADVAHVDVDVDVNIDIYKTYTSTAERLIVFLNSKTKNQNRLRNPMGKLTANAKTIINILKKGYTEEQCKKVIARMHREWKGDEKMSKCIRVSTLFRISKFEEYLSRCES